MVNPDFILCEDTQPTQEVEVFENREGTYAAELRPNKFNNVNSLTILFLNTNDVNYSQIYYIGFTGVTTNVIG